MRILILNNEFPPLGGGTGVINYEVMKQLEENQEIEVDLVTSSRSRDEYETECFNLRSWVFKVPVNNKNIHHSTNIELLRYTFRGARQALDLMRQKNYDVCWAYATVPAGLIALFLRLWRKLPYILITQGPDIPWYEKRYYPIYPFLLPIIKQIWKYAEIVTAQSHASGQLISRTSPNLPVRIIYNGVDLEKFLPEAELLRQRGQREVLTFICSGRLIERKGQRHLIQAADFLNKRGYHKKFKIVLIGTGDYEQELHKLCADLGLQQVVIFAGFVPRDQMAGFYAEADVFILPSYNEGMSVALLEALASSLPVVVTQTGGTTELVKENGFIIPWADPDALATALEKFLHQPELCQQMGQRSLEIVKGFTWQQTAQAYLDLSRLCVTKNSLPQRQ